MKQPKKETKEKTIPVMYHGERVSAWNRKIIQLFKDKKGEEYYFTSIKNVWFGSIYLMVKESQGHSMKKRPESIESDWEPTEKEQIEYEAQKAVVTSCRQRMRKAMKLKRPHANIVRAAELIKPFYLSLSDIDRGRFIEWFANECSKK